MAYEPLTEGKKYEVFEGTTYEIKTYEITLTKVYQIEATSKEQAIEKLLNKLLDCKYTELTIL